jgi:AraC-like DNA-binding protein
VGFNKPIPPTKQSEETRKIQNNNGSSLDSLQASFQAALEKEELFSKIVEFFPYPIQIHSPDGISVMVNSAMLEEFEVPDRNMVIGKYNILEDPDISKYGLMDAVKRAFNGETVHLTDIEVPLKSIRDFYKTESHNIDAMYQDATLFPVIDDEGRILYVVVILITRRIYKGKESIIKAKEYLKNNWLKDFNLEEVAKAVNLSPYYFSRLFKKEVGTTPHNYYMDIKIEKVKEMLCDTDLSISEVFTCCGMDYHGHYAKLFKKSVGVTPSQYRKRIKNK